MSAKKVVKKEAPNKTKETEVILNMTPGEQALKARIDLVDKSWKTIREEDIDDFSLSEDKYKLPKEAQDKLSQFAFRWVEETPERVDGVRNSPAPLTWWLCNRTNTPFLAKFCDATTGAVRREGQILVFKPRWMFEMIQAKKRELADARVGAGELASQDGKTQVVGKSSESVAEFSAGSKVKIGSGDIVEQEEGKTFGVIEEDASGLVDITD